MVTPVLLETENKLKNGNETMLRQNIKITFVIICLLIGGYACVRANVAVEDRESQLLSRVEAFMRARELSDLKLMKNFYRTEESAKTGNMLYTGGEIVSHKILEGENRADVKIEVNFRVMGFEFKKVPQVMTWIWEKGDWYLDAPTSRGPMLPPSKMEDK